MLAQQLSGRTLAEAIELAETFKGVMRGGDWPEGVDPGDLEALEGVKNFPVRIKCALLAWMTLEQALAEVAPELAGNLERDSDIEVRAAN
jgi:nitrogen fixation NifU-like protein